MGRQDAASISWKLVVNVYIYPCSRGLPPSLPPTVAPPPTRHCNCKFQTPEVFHFFSIGSMDDKRDVALLSRRDWIEARHTGSSSKSEILEMKCSFGLRVQWLPCCARHVEVGQAVVTRYRCIFRLCNVCCGNLALEALCPDVLGNHVNSVRFCSKLCSH